MTIVTLWLLISVGGYGTDQVVLVERFQSAEQCEHVRKHIPLVYESKRAQVRCIKAEVAVR